MRNLPVHWYEGMFLRPQHFQAAERYWSERVSTSDQWDNQYNYGLAHLELSRESLANSQVQIASCRARMRDGTLVSIDVGQEPDRINLKDVFSNESSVLVYLAIPKLSIGRANVSAETGINGHARYVESAQELQDESRGGNDASVEFRNLNLRVMLSTDDMSGFEVLPIARIKRAGTEEATPQIDEDYIPPLISVDCWQPLALDIVRAIFDLIGEKIDVLSQRAVERKMNFSSQQPGDVDDLLMLSALNQSYGVLHCLTFAQTVHPFVVYYELCRTLGSLAVFGDQRRVDDYPQYDHDDLARIFRWLKSRIEQLLGSRKKVSYEQRFFVGTDRGMQVAIDADWLHQKWDWYVGVNGHNVSAADGREILRPGKLNWKLGSSTQVDLIFRHGLPGVEMLELMKAPRALPPHGWLYYEIQRENASWKDVLATQTLGMRFTDTIIANLNNLPGQRQLEVMNGDKRAILEFALFAVRKD